MTTGKPISVTQPIIYLKAADISNIHITDLDVGTTIIDENANVYFYSGGSALIRLGTIGASKLGLIQQVICRTISIVSTADATGGLTRITTHIPHGLSVGDSVLIAGVNGGSYSPNINGTFTVMAIDAINMTFDITCAFTSAGTHGYIKQFIDETGKVASNAATYNWTVPSKIILGHLTGCGGGQGGAGGHATGGGGGGGGASSSAIDLPLILTPGEIITFVPGIGGLGGAVGAVGGMANTSSRISGPFTDDAGVLYLTSGQHPPTLRPDNLSANVAQPGGSADGGRGGYGAPLWGTANSQVGDGGPAPGAAGTGATVGGDGAVAVSRGRYMTTGGAGGGGGSTGSKGGCGGSDTLHQDNNAPANGSGGGGGSSHLGKGGLSGDAANSRGGAGEWGNGFGAGGGGGKTNKIGGDGSPGILIVSYTSQ